jgi:hypothetical protein
VARLIAARELPGGAWAGEATARRRYASSSFTPAVTAPRDSAGAVFSDPSAGLVLFLLGRREDGITSSRHFSPTKNG